MTTERAARCAAARTAFAQVSQYHRSDAPLSCRLPGYGGGCSCFRPWGALADVDVRVLHGCLVSLLHKFWGRRAYRFDHGCIVAEISAQCDADG